MEIELKDFISETLNQIIEGVKTSQAFAKANGALIAPSVSTTHSGIAQLSGVPYPKSATSIVEFDVAVTASKTSEDSGKVGVLVAVLGASGQSRNGKTNKQSSA